MKFFTLMFPLFAAVETLTLPVNVSLGFHRCTRVSARPREDGLILRY